MSRYYGLDASVGVELQLVYAGLAMPSRSLVPVDIVFVDAVVYDVPLVLLRELQYAIVSGTIDFFLGALYEDDRLFSYLDGAEGRG